MVERSGTDFDLSPLRSLAICRQDEFQKFKLSNVFKSAELFGDLRFRFESRSGKLGPEAGSIYDAENRWRYALRIGVRDRFSAS